MSISKREQLIRTAQKQFARNGFHAVGIDAILQGSGVARRTLYNHFRTKDELILAVLRYYDENFRNRMMRAVEENAHKPMDQLLEIFVFAERWFRQEDYHGCLFVAATSEYPQKDTAIRSVCREFKGSLLRYIAGLAKEAKLAHPRKVAEQLLLLFEGAIALAQINNSPVSARQAKNAARVLIKNASPSN